jgi:hypothetical protein
MGAVPLNRAPSARYLLGTDGLGRDMFSVMVIGIPGHVQNRLVAGAVGVTIGAVIGLLTGYYRGPVDTFFQQLRRRDARHPRPGRPDYCLRLRTGGHGGAHGGDRGLLAWLCRRA